MYNKRKKGIDFETKSFMNGPLVRASGHVIHAHSPLLPSWKPRTLLLCAHCCKDLALVRVRTHTKAATAAPLQLCRRHKPRAVELASMPIIVQSRTEHCWDQGI